MRVKRQIFKNFTKWMVRYQVDYYDPSYFDFMSCKIISTNALTGGN